MENSIYKIHANANFVKGIRTKFFRTLQKKRKARCFLFSDRPPYGGERLGFPFYGCGPPVLRVILFHLGLEKRPMAIVTQ